jgi:hypothetical protein
MPLKLRKMWKALVGFLEAIAGALDFGVGLGAINPVAAAHTFAWF